MRFLKYFFYESYPSLILADTGNCIVVFVEYGHYNYFVDYIPHIDYAFECVNFSVDTVKLLLQNGGIVIL